MVWTRRARVNGERSARRPGQPRGSKLEVHADFLFGLMAAHPGITLKEMRARLSEDCGATASIATLWRFLASSGHA